MEISYKFFTFVSSVHVKEMKIPKFIMIFWDAIIIFI